MSILAQGMDQDLIFHISEDVLVTNMDKELEDKRDELEEITVMDKIKINDKKVEINMYKNEDGVLMVPVRDLTESLGYELTWNGKENPIEIMKGAQWTKITLGKNSYSFAKMAEFQLESAPILKDSTTYVPVFFIEEVLRVEGFEVVDGMIEIE